MALQLTNKDLENRDELAKKLITLAEIVVRKHFYASINEKDDLVSIGVLKALNMIQDNKFTSLRGNLCTYLYTGMRNDMHNYLYHQNKFNTTDLSCMLDSGSTDDYFEQEGYEIPYSVVHLVCMRFSRPFGEGVESDVVKRLTDVGFHVVGKAGNKQVQKRFVSRNDILLDCYGAEAKDDVINRIVGLVLWKKKEHDA